MWEVSSIAYGGDDKYRSQNEPPQNEIPQNKTEAHSKRGGTSLKMSEKVTQSEGEYKKYLININNSSKSEKVIFLENEKEELQDSDKHEALELFESELSDEYRNKIILEFKRKEYPHEFYPPEKVIRNLVAYEWAKSKNTQSYRLSA